MNKRTSSIDSATLHRRAEEIFLRQTSAPNTPRSDAETTRLLHELQVHQIEMEMQNEELRQSRTELEAVLTRYTELYDFAPVGYFTITRDGVISELNLTGARVLGCDRQWLVGKRFARFVSEIHRPIFNTLLVQVFATKTKRHCEVELVHPGQRAPVIAIEATLSLDRKECRAVVMDITERKRTEGLLRLQSVALEEAANGIMITDRQGSVTWANPAFSRLTGYTLEEIVGRNPRFLKSGKHDRAFYQNLWETVLAGRTWQSEVINRRKDGSLFIEENAITPVTNERGEITHFLAVKQDITERKGVVEELNTSRQQLQQLNAELDQRVAQRTVELQVANKELEAFSYSVAHDLRAPLRGIDGFSRILLEDYGDKLDKEGKDTLGILRAASQRMGQLIDDLLDLARVTRSELRRSLVDLSALAEAVAADLKRSQPEREVCFVIAPSLAIEADPGLSQTIVENLLDNAWKFTGKRGQAVIEFGSIEYEGQLAYFVRDNGAGFDMAYSHKLFGAFQRLHDLSEFSGTGIGLATVQRIVHRHGGRVWAEGQAGKGATFFFTIPKLIKSVPP